MRPAKKEIEFKFNFLMQTAMKKSAISLAFVLMMGGALACAQQPEKKATAEAPQTEATQQAAPELPVTEQEAGEPAVSEPAATERSEEAAPAPATDELAQEGAEAPNSVN